VGRPPGRPKTQPEEIGGDAEFEEPARTSRSPRGAAPRARDEEFIDPETGEPYRRRSPTQLGAGIFELDEKWKMKGWDYQWAVTRVLNQPTDNSEFVTMRAAGWRYVKATEMPQAVPPGWTEPYIERGGQVLMKRPMQFTREAQKEFKDKADQALIDKFATAEMTPVGAAPRTVREIRRRYERIPREVPTEQDFDEV
jgi:hypothetical protein